MTPAYRFGLFELQPKQRRLLTDGRPAAEALARPEAQGRDAARCRALWAAGQASFSIGRYGDARDCAEKSLVISREIRDDGRAAEALRFVGYANLALGDRATARSNLQEALALARRLADKNCISKTLNGLGELHRAEGDLVKAALFYQEALALSREREDRSGIACHLSNLANTLISLGAEGRARGMAREGLAIAEAIGAKRWGVAHLDCTTALAAFLGEWECAARIYGATEALMGQLGYHREPLDEASLAPLVHRTREALGAAAFGAAEAAGRSLSYDEAIAEARAWLEQRS